MRISDNEVKKILSGQYAIVEEIVELGEDNETKHTDADLIKKVTSDVIAMPDRDEIVADLKAKIEAGIYQPAGEDIADAMIRRSVADKIKG